MKTKLSLVAMLISVVAIQAQTDDFKHFEVNATVNFWTPTSLHLKNLNSVTQYAYPNGTYSATGNINGYGPSLAPGVQINYYFKNNIGVALGFCLIHMDNEMSVQTTDTTQSNYENLAEIANLTLGISGRYLNSESFYLYYEAGIDIVMNYDLEMQYSSESADSPDMDANGSAIGVYCKTGIKIKMFSSLFFNAAFAYSLVPVEMEYTNSEGTAKINENTNLGGIGLQTGFSFNF